MWLTRATQVVDPHLTCTVDYVCNYRFWIARTNPLVLQVQATYGQKSLLKLVYAMVYFLTLCYVMSAVYGDTDLIGPVLQKKLQARLKALQLSSAQK